MKLHQPMTGKTESAVVTTNHSASCYGQPVVVIYGQAYGAMDVAFAQWQIAEATEQELRDLARMPYAHLLLGRVET